jgi:penicillin amidase
MSVLTDFLAPVARLILTSMSRRRLPRTDGTIELPGLGSDVQIRRDRWGVPHIVAGNIHDLFFAQAWVHCQDRLWQMELNRRTGQGRLAEVIGALALDTDRAARTFGFNRLGRADWESTSPDLREVLLAYAEGVNAFLAHPGCKMPVEFALLGIRPEPWTPEDSLAFSRVMIWQLSHAWYGEIVRAEVLAAVGAERAAEWDLSSPATNPLTLPLGIEFNRLEAGRLVREQGPFLHRGMGSNSWVLSAAKSATGRAMLCNDMHLALAMPSLWHEAHLEAGDFQVSGVCLPGVPLVMVGHNARIAWGMTLANTDCEDLFIERFDPHAPLRYQDRGQWREAERIDEVIRVKGRAEPHVEQVVVTRHGPVISDVVGASGERLAVCSMALRPCPAIRGWYRLNAARDWDDFVEAMRLIEAPQLSVTYADADDNIGYWVTGKVPVRAKGDGTVPAPGWTGECDWIGEVPFEEMPHALNPEQGFIVTCNNKLVSDDYPHFLGNEWMNGWRARRITDVLASKEKVSIEDCMALQMDVTCLPGRELASRLPGLVGARAADPDVGLALALLRDWDYRVTPESPAASLYEVIRYTLVRNLLEPGLGPELALRLMGEGFHPLLFKVSELQGRDTAALLRILDRPDSWWVQQAGGRQELVVRSIAQAVQWLRREMGPRTESWQWGRIHRQTFAHPLGMQKPLDKVFNRGPFPMGGDADTPCQTACTPSEPYESTAWAPSFRQIVEPRDWTRSLIVHPPGQSGNLASPHYDDLAAMWREGRYHPMLWTREQVEIETETMLRLRASRTETAPGTARSR